MLTICRAALIALLALGGCMKIYPDPELPDAMFEWYEGDCMDNVGDVSISITGIEDPTEHHELTVPCTTEEPTIKDVSRQRYRVVGQLHDLMDGVYSATTAEIDLRNGFDETVYLDFGSYNNVRVAWTFDMGASCASLGVDGVAAWFYVNGEVLVSVTSRECELGVMSGSVPEGTYSVTGLAYADARGTVAMSPPIPDVVVDFDLQTDVGTMVLAPCAPNCPQL